MMLRPNQKVKGKQGCDHSDLFLMNNTDEFKQIHCIKFDSEEMKFDNWLKLFEQMCVDDKLATQLT